ncbi:hypothetical protein HZS_7708, partial [Henneguya salminicola]
MILVLFLTVSLFNIIAYVHVPNNWFDNVKRTEIKIRDKQNIIILTASELGWDDISLHGNPLAVTPNMDTFARHGVTLNSHYINSWEFSTKVELFSGKYAGRFGLQHGPINNSQPLSFPSDELSLPKVLKQHGYKNHFVGKWGLGFYKKSSLPIYQGFDTFFGSISSQPTDYYNFNSTDGSFVGYDLYNNTEIVKIINETYAPILFTDVATDIIYQSAKTPEQPFFLFISLQLPQIFNKNKKMVPEKWLKYFQDVYDDENKKTHAAMVMALDISLGRIMDALAASSILDDSTILFLPESTAKTCDLSSDSGCNYPLRGGKGTVWEGGIRTSALFYSSNIKRPGSVIDDMVHVTDWFPTLASIAKVDISTLGNINGVNILSTLLENKNTKRTYIFHNFDTYEGEISALRVHEYKLIIGGKLGPNSGWNKERSVTKNQTDALLHPGFRTNSEARSNNLSIVLCDNGYPHPLLSIHAPPCKPTLEPCLFNLIWDPCEYHNLASFMERTVDFMQTKLNEIKKLNGIIKPLYPKSSELADPKTHNGNWQWWVDDTIMEGVLNINSTNSSQISNINALNPESSNNTSKITIGIDEYYKTVIGLNSTQTKPNTTYMIQKKNTPSNSSDIIMTGIIEHPSINKTDIENDEDVEKMWNLQHDTLNLSHFLKYKDSKNENKKLKNSKNMSFLLSNISSINNISISITDELLENSTNIQENMLEHRKNYSTKDNDLNEKTEILEIYETPPDPQIDKFPINDIEKENSKIHLFEEIGTKRTNLPSDNIIDYKFAVSTGKTKIKTTNESIDSAYLKTKAIAGGQYDEKSNRYDGEKGFTSIDDKNLKIWSGGSETTTRVYSLSQELKENNNKANSNSLNTSVEELFIDWDLLSKQSSFVTVTNPPQQLNEIFDFPKNLVTSEPVVTKSSIFVPYSQEDNSESLSNQVLFQRTLQKKPEINSYVFAESDADKQTSINIHNLTYNSMGTNQDFIKEIEQKFTPITPTNYATITPSPYSPVISQNRDKIETLNDNMPNTLSDLSRSVMPNKIDMTNSNDNQIKMIFDQPEDNKKMPFHGSLVIGPSHVYEFQGTAKNIGSGEENSIQTSSNRYLYSNNNEDQNHVYGISLLQPNLLQLSSNQTEITESQAKIKLVQNITNNSSNLTSISKPSVQIQNESNLTNGTGILIKHSNINDKTRVVKSDIPSTGVIGDESYSPQNSDDIFKLLSIIDNKTDPTPNKTEIVQEIKSNKIILNNIENQISILVDNSTSVENEKPAQNLTDSPFSIFSLINNTRGEKKGYPLARPLSGTNSGATVVSTIVAVVLSAFVIIGMAVIAIVAILAKNFGASPIEKSEKPNPLNKKSSSSTSS